MLKCPNCKTDLVMNINDIDYEYMIVCPKCGYTKVLVPED